MAAENLLKWIATFILFIIWCAGLSIVWWLFGPETFWQRLAITIIEIPVAVLWGVVCGIGAYFVWDW